MTPAVNYSDQVINMSVLRSSILSETAVIILSYRLMVKFISLMLIFHSLQDKNYKNFPGEKPPLLGGRFAAGKGRGRKGGEGQGRSNRSGTGRSGSCRTNVPAHT